MGEKVLSIIGILILFITSFLHFYCSIGMVASATIRPMIFDSKLGKMLQIGWIMLFLTGAGLLFMVNWILGITAVFLYWFVLPLIVIPIIKRYMLPPWDLIRDVLEKQGYTKNNYLSGDWWKDPAHRKREKGSESVKKQINFLNR